MSNRCPYCKSELTSGDIKGTVDGSNPITWECGSIIDSDVIKPTDLCKERMEKRLEIKPTPVTDYITALKNLDPLLPEKLSITKEKNTDNFKDLLKEKLGLS
jgi:hypothetical protein